MPQRLSSCDCAIQLGIRSVAKEVRDNRMTEDFRTEFIQRMEMASKGAAVVGILDSNCTAVRKVYVTQGEDGEDISNKVSI